MVEFQQGLLITAIGMGLVFAVIILLWGLMALMMRVTSREPQMDDQVVENPLINDPDAPEKEMVEGKRRAAAAAIAVGIAMAGKKLDSTADKNGDKKGTLSPWQTVHRSRQLEKRKR
jgi:Na+-transporting methylmalonyl-CoA/oxaloacetate decarboxylase gamma subunit